MLSRKWTRLERSRPQLRWARWGMIGGAVAAVAGLVAAHGLILPGVAVAGGSAVWAYRILTGRRD
ncbi:conserved protein of unknown function [Candidatus Hydrogenisulfobacillus filiaventi]|uniref:Uncharacterized protein n=1 Tax=Candidatus Hydrogenisulfobacillus filiaventi TaxID=2707344 RepID=A0A6F8ZG76_9FIRM|nr:hypothetical protein [Bacillota bacterium]CAB1128780.1 conserved protein of unknown function [Candidatus Hydrogenisulfobacillus filiaventi]